MPAKHFLQLCQAYACNYLKVGYPGVEPEPFGSQNRRASFCTSTRIISPDRSTYTDQGKRIIRVENDTAANLGVGYFHRGIESGFGSWPKKKDSMPHVATSSLLDDSKEGSRRCITTYAERSEESPAASRVAPNVQVVVLVVE